MGIKEDVTISVSQAFDTDLADAVKSIRHRAIEWLGYEAGLGKVNKMVVVEDTRGVFTSYDKSEVDDEKILDTDVRLLVLEQEFPTKPKVDDEIIELDNTGAEIKTYKIISFMIDPVDSTYEIQLRTSSDTG